MRKFISAALMALLFSVPVNASFSWKPVITRTAKSIVFLGNADEHCSGFVINSKKNYVLTAAHCKMNDGTVPVVDDMAGYIVKRDETNDFMVLQVPSLAKPALKLAPKDAKQWDSVLLMGYQSDNRLLRASEAIILSATFTDKYFQQHMLVANDIIIPGESGGPIVNTAGLVVGMNQAVSTELFLSAGITANRLKQETTQFWGK